MHTTEILIKKENNSERRRNQLVPGAQKEATKKKPNTDEQRLHSAQQGWRAAGWLGSLQRYGLGGYLN